MNENPVVEIAKLMSALAWCPCPNCRGHGCPVCDGRGGWYEPEQPDE